MITLDGYSEKHFGLIPLQTHIHPSIGNIQNKEKKIPGTVGIHDIGSVINAKYFEFEFAIKEANESAIQDKLNDFIAFLSDDTGQPRLIRLIFDYESDKYYTVKLNDAIIPERIRGFGKFTVSFVAFDPCKYSTDVKSASLDNATYNDGYNTTGQIIVNIDEDVDHLKVTLQENGEYIYLEDDFKTGDEILINLEDESVRKNGNLIMDKLYFESDFFDIPVGEFIITLSSGEGILEFRERWL